MHMPFDPVILHVRIYPPDILSHSTNTCIMVFTEVLFNSKKLERNIRRALIKNSIAEPYNGIVCSSQKDCKTLFSARIIHEW